MDGQKNMADNTKEGKKGGHNIYLLLRPKPYNIKESSHGNTPSWGLLMETHHFGGTVQLCERADGDD